MNEPSPRRDALGPLLQLGFYVFLIVIGLPLFATVLAVAGYLISAAGSTFATGLTANLLTLRVFERANPDRIGLGWRPGSGRNLSLGLAAGVLGAATVTIGPLLAGFASFERDPVHPASWSGVAFVLTMLLFGAVGEELIFRGYGFQVIAGRAGVPAALLASSVLFGTVHLSNLNASPLGIVNTVGFGVVLGCAVLRSRDLWLAIGIHAGWNWLLPLAGVQLSGFTIGLTGYTLRWHVSEIWSGGSYGPEASVLTCIVIVALLLWLRRAPVVQAALPLAERSMEV